MRLETFGAAHPQRLRLYNVFAAIFYLSAFWFAYVNYISIEHAYAGMFYRPLDTWEFSFVLACIIIVSAVLPTQVSKPSEVILWFLFTFCYVPTLPLTLITGSYDSTFYVPSLLALTASFAICSVASQLPLAPPDNPSPRVPDSQLSRWFIGVWIIMTAALVYHFRDIMSFAAVDDIYYQRQIASEAGSGNIIISYIRTYYNYVICPALAAYGLTRNKKPEVVLGMLGLVISYSIDGMKINFAIVLALIMFHIARSYGIRSAYVYTSVLSVLTALLATVGGSTDTVKYVADVIIYRSVAIPGQTFSQYYDLFSASGYTWWSNVRGISLVVPPPPQFAFDPDWPNLGWIVGRYYFHWAEGVNVNANPFSGEGIAAAGSLGVLVIGVVLAVWIRVFDIAARAWSPGFVVLVTVPMAMALSNVHLSTLLLSFGGAFWTLSLYFYRPAEQVHLTAPSQTKA